MTTRPILNFWRESHIEHYKISQKLWREVNGGFIHFEGCEIQIQGLRKRKRKKFSKFEIRLFIRGGHGHPELRGKVCLEGLLQIRKLWHLKEVV